MPLDNATPQLAVVASRYGLDALAGLLQGSEDARDVFQKRLPRTRQAAVARVPDKQSRPKFFFQLLDRPRQRRLLDVQPLRCMGEVEFFGNGQEATKTIPMAINHMGITKLMKLACIGTDRTSRTMAPPAMTKKPRAKEPETPHLLTNMPIKRVVAIITNATEANAKLKETSPHPAPSISTLGAIEKKTKKRPSLPQSQRYKPKRTDF